MNKEARGSYLGTQLSETPKVIQDTVKGLVGNAEVADVDIKTKDGAVNYDVEFERDGKNTRLKMGQNGGLLEDNRK